MTRTLPEKDSDSDKNSDSDIAWNTGGKGLGENDGKGLGTLEMKCRLSSPSPLAAGASAAGGAAAAAGGAAAAAVAGVAAAAAGVEDGAARSRGCRALSPFRGERGGGTASGGAGSFSHAALARPTTRPSFDATCAPLLPPARAGDWCDLPAVTGVEPQGGTDTLSMGTEMLEPQGGTDALSMVLKMLELFAGVISPLA